MDTSYTASFPEPLVVEPLSGVHKHTIILLHGRGGSADTFGPVLLNTPVPTTSTDLTTTVGLEQTARNGNDQFVTNPDHVLAVEKTISETPDFVSFSLGITPIDSPSSTGPPPFPDPAQTAPRSTSDYQDTPHNHRQTYRTLAEAFPHARFVFPSAPRQRATVYKRSIMRQWFDDWHLRPELSGDCVDHRYDEGLQTSGLGATVRYLHGLVAKEADLVGGVGNVVLGGMSQGCAASLVAALLWEGPGDDGRLGAVVGMCGWLPYLAQMKEAMLAQEDSLGCTGDSDDFELFERPSSPLTSPSVASSAGEAVSWLHDELELPGIQSSRSLGAEDRKIPVMICHGLHDKKVDRCHGQAAVDFLPSLGMEVRHWKSYDGVGHEYSGEMLADIIGFLKSVPQGIIS